MAEPSDLPRAASAPSWIARLGRTRLPLWITLALGFVLLAVLGWQRVAIGRAEAQLAAERQTMTRQFEADRNALLNEVNAKVDANADETKREFGMALAWAVRGEMIRNNLDQVDQFFAEVVKFPNTERAVLADNTGTVRVSTDRRYVGVALSTLVPVEATLPDAVAVHAMPGGPRLLIVPIMGLNSRLGTVVVSYRQPALLGGS